MLLLHSFNKFEIIPPQFLENPSNHVQSMIFFSKLNYMSAVWCMYHFSLPSRSLSLRGQ